MKHQRFATAQLGLLCTLGMASCAGPLYYARPGATPGSQAAGSGQLQQAYSPAQSAGMSGWAPQVRGGSELGQGGGAYSATPPGQTAAADAARVVGPGSTGITAPFTQKPGPTTPLYGDGGVVYAEPAGSRMALDAPARDLEPGGTGRPLMLQQYQAVLEERDSLRIEVEALTGQLELMQERIVELQHDLQAGDFGRAELEQVQNTKDKRIADLEAQNADLSARLVTAQIRRLESEKDLIQILIDKQRAVPAPAAGAKQP
ncbi:hypothetical protein [Engelhardtia mirabilis]|uniref:Chromosome partition protein Smc n=1 Tax=Engelhardtia mirabilis TaxID=2528011 RepID=A0A518BSQ5_9BACT|nr:hypothetical protein Pla133_51210 [Planctomycetes bacterium Pla133]QDV04323.1 hypothetical protein Pla86_51180 [Planctomycetes bacterium Pla86]